jgi:ubiquinone/menaquinone biosynthesis C-methylase UbiE
MIRHAMAVWVVATSAIWAQNTHPLTGRKIPSTAGDSPAAVAARADPDAKDQSVMALGVMGVEEGMTVADVCGVTDYYASLLAGRVGDSGTVYAVEIQPALLDDLRKMVASRSFTNVKLVRGTDVNPRLPAGKINLVLLANSYSGFSRPQEMLRKIRESLKADGKLVVIEYRAEDQSAPASGGTPMTVQEIKKEIEAEGFKFQKVVGLVRQHILIFSLSSAGAGPATGGHP